MSPDKRLSDRFKLKTGPGKYDILYRRSNLLWDDRPGRCLRWLKEYESSFRYVLDAGCGDGKNAKYISSSSEFVSCIDVSEEAQRAFEQRCRNEIRAGKVGFQLKDLVHAKVGIEKFGLVIFYGVAHCLSDDDLKSVSEKLSNSVLSGGWLAFSGFNDEMEVPPDHGTGELKLRSRSDLIDCWRDFEVVRVCHGSIRETHPLVPEHEHSVTWFIARKK